MLKGMYPLGGFAAGKITNEYATSGNPIYSYNYRIIDSDFNEEWVGLCDQRINYTQVRAGAIISCYESKGLNVAFNLAIYHRWMQDKYDWYGRAGDEVRYNMEHTIGYAEYAPKVREYLARYNNLKTFW